MSNTRKAASGKPFRQERFASSAEFERGLLANLVARRCEVLESQADRELVWFVQYLSHQPGGLKAVAISLLEKFGDRIGTASMREFGSREGQIYDAEKVRVVRSEMPLLSRLDFLLSGERGISCIATSRELMGEDELRLIATDTLEHLHGNPAKEVTHPKNYPAKDFVEACRRQMDGGTLENLLREMCLNPAVRFDCKWLWWFAEFPDCVREFQSEWVKQHSANTVTTEIGRKVAEALNFALETRCVVLVEGMSRIGKTVGTKAWCDKRPGRVRYAEVPSSNDEIGFYRAIAKSAGVSINLNSKSQELRQRIEETFQNGDLMLVLDEAHYCWPNLIDPRTVPGRINWIMTALVNKGVPVALIATPQFLKAQKVIEEKTRWTSEQFTGRLGHYEPLPQTVSENDLGKVAAALLPEGDTKSIEILVHYAKASAKYLAGIEAAVRRARYLAKLDGRDKANRADIKRAINESVIPSDSALSVAMATPQRGARRRSQASELTADYSLVNDRTNGTLEINLSDRKSELQPNQNRLEARRESDVLMPG